MAVGLSRPAGSGVSVDFVAGRFPHTADGDRLRVRLGLRDRWAITSVVAEGAGYLVTDDRWFEGTLGMHRLDARGKVVASGPLFNPVLETYDGEVVTFTAMQKTGRRYVRRAFTTDLVDPPRRVSG